MTFKLSPSSLGLMKECPRCFWLTKHKIWKRPSGAFPSLPSGIDRILKTHFDKFMKKGELPPELRENGLAKGVKLFENEELLKTWRNNLKGIEWHDKKGNILRGAVDNVLSRGKKLIVLDYKTKGYPVKENDHEYYQHQIDIYNFLLRKNGYATEDYSYLLFYVPSEVMETGEIVFDTELRKIKTDVGNAERLFSGALKLLNGRCPKKSCEWCEGVKR